MTQRVYFDLTNGQALLADDEGVETSDLDEAMEALQAVLHEMRSSGEFFASEAGWSLIIRDEGGTILKTLPLT